MRRRTADREAGAGVWPLGLPRTGSWTLVGLTEAVSVLGLVAVFSGLVGLGDDNGDALAFTTAGVVLTLVGFRGRRRVFRPPGPTPHSVITGTGILWGAMIGLVASVYLATGTIVRLDNAVVEAAAGLTTTAVTALPVPEVSRAVLVWRAGTSWVGGLAAIVVSIVVLPQVLRGTALPVFATRERWLELVPNYATGQRRVAALYGGFTLACILAYLGSGLSPTDALVHGLSTASTGGFSTNPDSFAAYGTGPRAVATGAMIVAGAGLFLMWGVFRGRARCLWRSQELRLYFAILVGATVILVTGGDGLGIADALFTVVSIASTTGFATREWTTFGSAAVGALLVTAGVGSMLSSAGGGIRVLRARLLMAYGRRELRRQLDPHAVVVTRHDDQPLDDRTLDQLGGFSVAHLTVVGCGALLLAGAGMSVPSGVWSAVSAVSTLGPAPEAVGAFGHLEGVTRPARLLLVVLMLAGRVPILSLLASIGFVLRFNRSTGRRARRLSRSLRRMLQQRRLDREPRISPDG